MVILDKHIDENTTEDARAAAHQTGWNRRLLDELDERETEPLTYETKTEGEWYADGYDNCAAMLRPHRAKLSPTAYRELIVLLINPTATKCKSDRYVGPAVILAGLWIAGRVLGWW